MKILIVNGSPRGTRGATFGVVEYFMKGAKEAGASVDVLHLTQYKINHCTGCFSCWTNTPGKCIHKDDVENLFPRLDVDLLVLATPVYVDGMTGLMKNFLDRLIPLSSGKVEIVNGHSRHPSRYGKKHGERKLALISVSGFPELDNFDPLVKHVEAVAKNMQSEFVGAILRPNAWIIPHMLERNAPVEDIIEAVVQSGKDIVQHGEFDRNTLNIISREIMPAEKVAELISQGFQ
ncbi:MAG: flavodoxin family protein [Candidatus Lokiarchaeota archaeon]|nr:flavodoxin family protein [Candidatus Lokiarchaeota archaeon]